jgi:hypothetical protein
MEIALKDYPDDHDLQLARNDRTVVDPTAAAALGSPPPTVRPEVVELRQKLEEAYKGKRYVAPQSDSAVFYANEILKYVPQDPRAMDLKQDSRLSAEKELEQLIAAAGERSALSSEEQGQKVRSDFQHAREILAGLRYFWPADNRLQNQLADLSTRTKNLDEFLSFKRMYPVVHSHGIGSCKGTLSISAYGVAYHPDSSNHGFDKHFKDLRDMKWKDGGDSLEFKVEQRTMTFKINKDVNKTVSISAVDQDIREIQSIRDRLERR